MLWRRLSFALSAVDQAGSSEVKAIDFLLMKCLLTINWCWVSRGLLPHSHIKCSQTKLVTCGQSHELTHTHLHTHTHGDGHQCRFTQMSHKASNTPIWCIGSLSDRLPTNKCFASLHAGLDSISMNKWIISKCVISHHERWHPTREAPL